MPHPAHPAAVAVAHSSGEVLSLVVTLCIVGAALVVVLYSALWRTFTWAGRPGWAAIVPFYNVWVLLQITGKPRWWLVLWFVPVADIVVAALVWREIARGYGRGRAFTAGLVVLPWVFLPVAAFGGTPWTFPGGDGSTRTAARSTDRAAWVTALVAAAAVVALALVWAFVPPRNQGVAGALTAQEQSAVVAAGTIAADLATYSRAHFDSDFARAVNLTTGALKKDLQSRKATTKQTLTANKFDLYAKVQHSALVGPIEPGPSSNATGYVVLIALYGYTTKSPETPNPQNLKVTVQRVNGKWLASDVSSEGVQ